jgi:hypothetical protein
MELAPNRRVPPRREELTAAGIAPDTPRPTETTAPDTAADTQAAGTDPQRRWRSAASPRHRTRDSAEEERRSDQHLAALPLRPELADAIGQPGR